MLSCPIVKDLLPSYIDQLVSQETKNEINQHLQACPGCQLAYEQMKKSIDLPVSSINNGEVNYLKKIKKSTLKKLALGFTVLTGIFAILIFVFIIGSSVESSDFRIETSLSLDNDDLADSQNVAYFNIDMTLLNDKELMVRRDYIYGEKNEVGIRPVLGYILTPYEVQPSFIQDDHSNTYSFGVSSNSFEVDGFSVVLRLKDRDVTFNKENIEQ